MSDIILLEEFLRLVLPWQGAEEGTYKSIWGRFIRKDGQPQVYGRATQDFNELVKMAVWCINHSQDTYVALGTQRAAAEDGSGKTWKKASRLQTNIVSLKSIFLDVDAGNKGYYDTDAAAAAVNEFLAATGLPDPTVIVGSGSGGMHIYWVFDLPIPVNRWQPIAFALARATQEHGLQCDTVCTVDSARILRVPQSFNFKGAQPMPVTMSPIGQVYDVRVIENLLVPYMGPQPVKGPRQKEQEHDELTQRFLEGLAPEHHDPVSIIEVAEAGCEMFDEAIKTGGRDHAQPMWNLNILAATFDPDPAGMAHVLSCGYPKYDPAEVDTMLARKQGERASRDIGWPSCLTFSHQRAACRACKFFGDNKTPFHILTRADTSTPDLDLPSEYWRSLVTQRIMTKVKLPGKDAPKEAVPIEVLPYQFFDPRLDDETGDFVCKTYIGKDEKQVYLPAAVMKSPEQFVGALIQSRVFCVKEYEAQNARRFFMAWMQKLQAMKQARVVPVTLGWTDNLAGFTYDKRTFTPNGEVPAFIVDPSMLRYYNPTGERKPWDEAAKLILSMQHPALEVLLASAFAGPLVSLSGMPGLLLSAYSQESGVGKSTAMRVAQAVWGHPVKGMNILNDTPNFIVKKLVDIQHLPLFWDELKLRKEIDEFVKLLFRLTQGKDKSRLDRNSTAREVGSFSTILVAASNDSLAEGMGRATDTTTAGANRVFEIVVSLMGPAYSVVSVQQAIARLDRNYGHAGLVYAQWLGANGKLAAEFVTAVQEQLEKDLNVGRDERFWVATMAVLISGATIAKMLDLVDFDIDVMHAFLMQAFEQQRHVRAETVADMTSQPKTSDLVDKLITSLMNRHMIITNRIWRSNNRPPHGTITILNMEEMKTMQEVWAQFGKNDHILRVNAAYFQKWLVERGYSPQTAYSALKDHYGMVRAQGTIGGGTANHALEVRSRVSGFCWDITLPDLNTVASPGSSQPT